MLGSAVLFVRSLLLALFLFLIPPLLFFPPWSVLHALCSKVSSEMAGTGEKLICVSFLEQDGSEQTCSLFVLFELCKSLFFQAEPLDWIHS